MAKEKRGPKIKPEGYEYKHKRAASLTDTEFKEAKELFGTVGYAVIFAIKVKKMSIWDNEVVKKENDN